MKKAISFFGISLIFLLLLSQGSTVSGDVTGETESNTTTVETDALVVEIKGGMVPFYFFWSADSPDVKYKIQMDGIFEANDTDENGVFDLGTDKKDGASTVALASLAWEFSELRKGTDTNSVVTSIDFNITSTVDGKNPTVADTMFQFRNHIDSNAESQLKFDVVIDNYVFNDDKAMLVFAFKIMSENDNDAEPSQDGQLISFGDGFFHSEDVAKDDNGDIGVGLSQASEEGEGKLYLAYEHFEGKLIHDPTIGIGSGVDSSVTSGTSDPGSVDEETDQNSSVDQGVLPELSRGSLFAPTILATLVFIGIPIVVYNYKRNS